MTVHPMVRTRKKVPINSTTYLFIAALTPAHASHSEYRLEEGVKLPIIGAYQP
jgi:hypothetical protein